MAVGVLTGRQILDRWGILPFELVEIIFAGQIVAVDPVSGEKHDKESDNCFFCKRVMKHYSLCDARKAYLAWNNVEGTCSNKMRAEYRNRRLDELKFRVIDVEEYEQKNNLIKKSAVTSRDKFAATQRNEVTSWSSAGAWISGKEIMERFGWLPVELAIISFMFDVAVTCPRRGTILDIYTRIVTALWYKENEKVLDFYGEDRCDLKLFMQELLEKTKIEDLSLDSSSVFFNFWFDNCGSFLFSIDGINKAKNAYIDAGVLKKTFIGMSIDECQNRDECIKSSRVVADKENGIDFVCINKKFKDPKEHRDFLFARDPSIGRIMLELREAWKLKKIDAAAIACGDPVPEDKENRERYGEKWRYHTKKLKQID